MKLAHTYPAHYIQLPALIQREIDLSRTPEEIQNDRVTLTSAARQLLGERPYTPPDGLSHHPPVDESERTPQVVQAQNEAVKKSLETGKPVVFRNSEGQEFHVRVVKNGDGYRYQLENGNPVKVSFSPEYGDLKQHEALSKLLDYHSQMPERHRGILTEVSLERDGAMGNTAARREGTRFRFFGEAQLNEANFTHEYGHLLGTALESEQDTLFQRLLGGAESYWFSNRSHSAPDTWAEAMKNDQRTISGYATSTKTNDPVSTQLGEDFAETFTAYHEARESGPEALAKFRRLYPHRAKIMEQLY